MLSSSSCEQQARSVVTIDGPSGSGKGTLAASLAKRLGYALLDSGALYRVLGLAASRQGLDPVRDPAAIGALAASLPLTFGRRPGSDTLVEGAVYLAEEDVSLAIRSDEASSMASRVAALPDVRAALLERQRGFQDGSGLVADGRDMGTTVFPDAILKVYLTASVVARADRRYKQLIAKGIDANLPALRQQLEERDARDSKRSASPLHPAEDAFVIDSTELSIQQTEAQLEALARDKGLLS